MVRPRVRDLFHAYYPSYRGEEAVFRDMIDAAIADADRVLDIGCGSGELCSHDLRAKARVVVGIDVDPGVAGNRWVTHAVRAAVGALPLRAGSVDLIVCRYVLEHLVDPRRDFTEVARVLRPNGRFVLLTPNAHHYVTLVSRFTPMWMHRLMKAGHGIDHQGVFPTYYRANTRRAIQRLGRDTGLRVTKLTLVESSPNYLEFSRVLYRIGIIYERIVTRFTALAGLRVNIAATLTKS